MKRFRYLLIILLMAAAFVFLSKFFERPHTVTYEEFAERIVFTSKSGYQMTIYEDQMRRLQYVEKMDFGTKVSGTNTRAEKSGTWKNDEFGEYFCCADGTVDCAIVVETTTHTYVANCESEEEALKLYDIVGHMLAYDCEG